MISWYSSSSSFSGRLSPSSVVVCRLVAHRLPVPVVEFLERFRFETEYFYFILIGTQQWNAALQQQAEALGVTPVCWRTVQIAGMDSSVVGKQLQSLRQDLKQYRHCLLVTSAAQPDEQDESPIVLRLRVSAVCIGCGICERICPRGCYTLKVWVQDQKTEQSAYEAVKASLQRLQLSFVDLVLLHQPMGDYFAAYRGIERACREGLTKAIGVANFYPAILANLCEQVSMIPSVNQIELHPFFAQPQALALMEEYGIVAQAWGPLAEGKHGIFTDPQLTAIGQKYGNTAAQVVLRWNVQRGVSIIPKSVHVERMKENLDIWDFSLSEEEMQTIAAKDLDRSEIVDHDDPAFVRALCAMKIHD